MRNVRACLTWLVCAAGPIMAQEPVLLTIATVDNPDMIRMQALSEEFTAANPHIQLNWITLGEGALRERVAAEIALGSRFDVLTLGTYEVPIWARRGWLVPFDELPPDYDLDDLLPPIRRALSVDGRLHAAPFYGESAMTMVRTDLLAERGLSLPEAPTWDEVERVADDLHDPENGIYGICLRGEPGWGENVALITAMANSMGARWFDEAWRPQFDTPEWRATLELYLALMALGPPEPETRGFNEVLGLYRDGRCALAIDATVAASVLVDPNQSSVADRVEFALAPDAGRGKRANWLWAWSLAIPASSDAIPEAQLFVAWATSREYTALVAERDGWTAAPPGTRTSLYENPDYLAAAPFAPITLRSITLADPENPTVEPVPYVGIQFVAIPEFQGLGTAVGREFAAAVAGRKTADEALAAAQRIALQEMTAAGYLRH